jgi:serpin B
MRPRRRLPTVALVTGALALVAACGAEPESATTSTVTDGTVPPQPTTAPTAPTSVPEPAGLVAVRDRVPSDADPTIAGEAVTRFGFELLTATAATTAPGDNLVLSPLSVAVALGMVEPGTSGAGTTELNTLLGIDDPAAWHASMSALEQSLEARQPEPVDPSFGEGQAPGELLVRIANAAFLQPGYPFRVDYLDAVGTNYGAVLEELDFAADQAAAAERINDFIADATDDRITDLVPPEAIEEDTVLALVNALLLQASWQSEFDAARTVDDATFTRVDGTTVTVPMMQGGSSRSGSGDGWVGASKQLIGGLGFEAVLPDEGRFDEIAGRYADVVTDLAASQNPGGELGVPRFETRVNTPLTDVLQTMGLTAPFSRGSLLGIADDPRTKIDQVLHEAWLSVDETGIEAAAATVALAVVVSAPIAEPVPVVLDRPFLFRIVDDASGATLFTGRIMDPTN